LHQGMPTRAVGLEVVTRLLVRMESKEHPLERSRGAQERRVRGGGGAIANGRHGFPSSDGKRGTASGGLDQSSSTIRAGRSLRDEICGLCLGRGLKSRVFSKTPNLAILPESIDSILVFSFSSPLADRPQRCPSLDLEASGHLHQHWVPVPRRCHCGTD